MKLNLLYTALLIFSFMFSCTTVEASELSPTLLNSHSLFYLIAGFGFGIVAYQLVLYYCTRITVYLYFCAALVSFTITVGHEAGIWKISPWLDRQITDIGATLGVILFTVFIQQFLILFVDLKRIHPRLTRIMDIYMYLGGFLILMSFFIPASILDLLKNVLISLVSLTALVSVRSWYPTVKHLRTFSVTVLLFSLLTSFWYGAQLFVKSNHMDLMFVNVYLFSATLLFLSFSSHITTRLNQDRKQRVAAQKVVIQTLEKYQILYENALEGLFTSKKNGHLLAFNPSLNQLLQLQSAEQPVFLNNYFLEPNSIWQHITRMLNQQSSIKNFEIKGNNSWYSLSARCIDDGNIEGSLTDITQRKQQELQLAYLASHDPLTGLYNRIEFESSLQSAIRSPSPHTLLFIDVDQFKVINDTCGHAAGDECLRQVAAILKAEIDAQDMLARLGGDEFGIILFDQPHPNARAGAEQLRLSLEANHFQWQTRIFKTSISIGQVMVDDHITTVEQALSLADAACYEAKDAGRNRVVINSPHQRSTIYRHNQMDMVATLNQALKESTLVLYQQAIMPISAASSNLKHYEILLRLQTDAGLLNPGAFMPAAQRYHLLPQIDHWVFSHVCAWLSQGDNLTRTGIVNINLSPQTLSNPSFLVFVKCCLNDYVLIPSKICFEITEYSALNNFSLVLEHIFELQNLGFTFALDDFGSGFASFDYVKRLPVDFIKIDGQFIHNISQDKVNKILVQAITDTAHALGKRVIAESIEDAETIDILRSLKVDFGQGYYFHHPAALHLPMLAPVMPVNFA